MKMKCGKNSFKLRGKQNPSAEVTVSEKSFGRMFGGVSNS